MNKLYDCGILNFWHTNNYGALLNCYALQESIKKLGLTPKVINYIVPRAQQNFDNSLSDIFAQKYLQLTRLCTSKEELESLNEGTSIFVAGSDQIWRYKYSYWQGKNIFQLNFAKTTAKKIAYAASFGTDKFEGGQLDTALAKYYMQRFDAISVREDDGVDICRRTFDVAATHVLDPVFLPEIKDWNKLIDNSNCKDKDFIASYVLDKSAHTDKLIDMAGKKTGIKKTVNMVNAQGNKNCKQNVEDWLYAIKNCRFFITDSFHGACFAIIFNKPFICLANICRGYSRFKSLFKIFGLENRCILNADDIENNRDLFGEIDYAAVNAVLKAEKERSLNWLKKALNAPKQERNPSQSQLDDIMDIVESLHSESDGNSARIYQNVNLILRYPSLRRKYLLYKILSKIMFGKTRKKYKQKRKELKAKIKSVKKLMKQRFC